MGYLFIIIIIFFVVPFLIVEPGEYRGDIDDGWQRGSCFDYSYN